MKVQSHITFPSIFLLSLLLLLIVSIHPSCGLERRRKKVVASKDEADPLKNEKEDECYVLDDGKVVCDDEDYISEKIKDNDDGEEDDFINVEIDDYYGDEDDHEFDDEFDDDDDEFDDDDDIPNHRHAKCVDNHELCDFWATHGECEANPNYMLQNCQKSCNSCQHAQHASSSSSSFSSSSKKKKSSITTIKDMIQAKEQESDDILSQISNYGVAQTAQGQDEEKTLFIIRKSLNYMKNYVHAPTPTHRMPQYVLDTCTNNEKLCSYWAALGECEANPSFMVTKCAPACLSCHKIDFDTRCPSRDSNAIPGLYPGSLNAMFERIVKEAPGNQTEQSQIDAAEGKIGPDGITPIYTVQVHRRPTHDSPPPNDDGTIPTNAQQDKEGEPWVITFDNFLSDEECDHLIQLGYKNKYERSKDVGSKTADGSFTAIESQGRTSANAWCDSKSGCREEPIAKRVMDRLSTTLNIPTGNMEDFQMLKYQVGEFYRTHHDYIGHQKDRKCGPRILTFFLYLSDVDEAGGTSFPQLGGEGDGKDGLVVTPKKGRALLWPSVMNYDPLVKDGRTTHQALPVEKGTKFAANAWIHLYEYVQTHKEGCA